ncbi:MAG: hypothetical protein PHH08_03565 [Candidatus ainarchaeum sp.]|nr:hypothetical protein [Candidatus ainarchaeum sp.]
MKKQFFVLFSFSVLFLSLGCTQQPSKQANSLALEEQAMLECKKLCNSVLDSAADLSKGPCLENPMQGFPDYACDIAHNPRQAVDGLPENQCSAFAGGKAGHFVELDTECKLIKIA